MVALLLSGFYFVKEYCFYVTLKNIASNKELVFLVYFRSLGIFHLLSVSNNQCGFS